MGRCHRGRHFENYCWNHSYVGVFSSTESSLQECVSPNLRLARHGRTVLPSIIENWAGSRLLDYYEDIVEVPDALHPPEDFEVPIGLKPPPAILTPIYVYPEEDRSDVW